MTRYKWTPDEESSDAPASTTTEVHVTEREPTLYGPKGEVLRWSRNTPGYRRNTDG